MASDTYSVEGEGVNKEVRLETDFHTEPTVADIVDAAKTEFPDIPFSELRVSSHGYDGETITLKKKGEF